VVDAHGHPLNFTLSRANWHDQRSILATLDGIRVGKRKRKPKRLAGIKGMTANRCAANSVTAALFRLPLIAKIMWPFLLVAHPKIVITNGTVGSAGRWNALLPGSITPGVWTASLNGTKKRIGPSCESSSCATT